MLHRPAHLEAGVVDQHVDGGRGAGGLYGGGDGGRIGDVQDDQLHRQAAVAQGVQGSAPGRIAQAGVHRVAGFGEFASGQQAKAAVGAAGDEHIEGHGVSLAMMGERILSL